MGINEHDAKVSRLHAYIRCEIFSFVITPTRILVIRFSSIGDIVLTTPVLRRLKQQMDGEVEIHFLTKKKFAGLLEANPYIHKVHTMEKTVQEPLTELANMELAYIIDLHNNIRSSVVKRRLKSLAFTFNKLNVRKWLWVNLGINTMPPVHVVDRYLQTIKAFGTEDDGHGLDYFIPSGAELSNDQFPLDFNGKKFVALVIGGAHMGKRMSAAHWADAIRDIPYPVVLLGGKEDTTDAETIVASCGKEIWNAVGQLSLHESASVVSKAEVVVTGDTGLMHIASAFQRKIVSLWGCTVPGFGMSPYRPHPSSIILEPVGRKKRPCSKLGNRCKYGMDHRCINQIAQSQIASAVSDLWNR
jgi:ADP-heptose:LPS heptosyltransferase